MKGIAKKGMALLVTLGFFASILAVMAPIGAASGRAPVFSVTATFSQAGQPATFYDVNSGGNLTIDMAVTNSGDNTTTATVVLGYHDDLEGFYEGELESWTPQTLNNDTPTAFNFTLEPFIIDYLFIYPMFNPYFWVNVSDTSGIPINQSFPIESRVATASVDVVAVTSSNAGNASMLVLGVDTLTVKVNVTAYAFGKDLTGGRINFYLDDTFGDPLGNVSMDTMTNNTQKQYSFQTNLSTVTPAPSFDTHVIIAETMVGVMTDMNTSAGFAIVEPKADVILTGMDTDPISVTVPKGATVPLTMTAHLQNNGTASAASATVHFYNGLTELNATVTGAIAAQATLDVSFVWNVTEAITPGNHTVGIGIDTQALPNYWVEMNITVVGVPNVTVLSLTTSAATEFEGTNVTLTAKLFNNGTEDSTPLTVEFYDGTTMIGNKTNITVAKGQTVDVTLVWTLPLVELDTNKTIKAKVAGSESPVNVTIRNKAPKIEILAFTAPIGRIGDNVTITATVKNNGTGDAVGMVVDFYDGATKVGSTPAFNLTVGSTNVTSVTFKLSGTGDANHTFFAKASGAEKNDTKMIGHTLSAASISIVSFTVSPKTKDKQTKDSTQEFKLTITLKNGGELAGSVTLSIKEGTKVIANASVPLAGGANTTQTYTWKVKGDATHKAVATITGDGTGTSEAKATLHYAPGFEVLVLMGSMIVALVLVRRRKN
jgi:hypothetical protein